MRTAIHEMRNHLCVAMAGIEAFLDRKLEPNDARLQAIFAALSSVNLLIDDLPRDRTVHFSIRLVPLDVCALIELQIAAIEGLATGRGVRLRVDRCANPPWACPPFAGDPVRIAQIVTNVLMNAIRYTPAGSDVHIVYRRNGTHLQLNVCDEGPGVEPADRARIFEDGYRGRSAPFPPGSGIGLALVRQFVEGHGGTIAVSDGPLRGAMFSVDLPGIKPFAPCARCGDERLPSIRAGSPPTAAGRAAPRTSYALGDSRRAVASISLASTILPAAAVE